MAEGSFALCFFYVLELVLDILPFYKYIIDNLDNDFTGVKTPDKTNDDNDNSTLVFF